MFVRIRFKILFFNYSSHRATRQRLQPEAELENNEKDPLVVDTADFVWYLRRLLLGEEMWLFNVQPSILGTVRTLLDCGQTLTHLQSHDSLHLRNYCSLEVGISHEHLQSVTRTHLQLGNRSIAAKRTNFNISCIQTA